jgi:hypothetical protein
MACTFTSLNSARVRTVNFEIRNPSGAGIAQPRLHSVGKYRHGSFVQRLIMDGDDFRQNGGMNIYRSY